MRLPILIKKRKLFIKYKNRWLNINSEISSRGGGWKGLRLLISGINKCRKGNHSYRTVFYTRTLDSSVECCYCHERKKDEYS